MLTKLCIGDNLFSKSCSVCLRNRNYAIHWSLEPRTHEIQPLASDISSLLGKSFDKDSFLDQTLVRHFSALFLARPQIWGSMFFLEESSFSQEFCIALNIWSPTIAHQIPYLSPLVSAHTDLSSARITPYPEDFLLVISNSLTLPPTSYPRS